MKALVSKRRPEYLFGLKQEYDRYKFYLQKIEECNLEIKNYLELVITHQENIVTDLPEKKPYKRSNKNSIKGIDLNIITYQCFGGVDLFQIPGVSFSTVLSLMCDIRPGGFQSFQPPSILLLA